MSRDVWILNENEGQDVVHHNPGERCNTDDVEGRQVVDSSTAHAMVDRGDARRCEHCEQEDSP